MPQKCVGLCDASMSSFMPLLSGVTMSYQLYQVILQHGGLEFRVRGLVSKNRGAV